MDPTDNLSRRRDFVRNVRGPRIAHVLLDRQRERPGRTPMALTSRVDRPGMVVLTLVGSIDHTSGPRIARAVTDQLHGSPQRVVLDLRRAGLGGPDGLYHLIAIWRLGQDHDFEVVLVAVPGPVLDVLRTTDVEDLVAIYPSLEEALA